MTVQPGTTTAQTTLVVPSGTLPGDYGIELQAGASMTSTGLVVVSVDWPTLVSFLVTRFQVPYTGGTMRVEVGLDRPAPAGGVVVRVEETPTGASV